VFDGAGRVAVRVELDRSVEMALGELDVPLGGRLGAVRRGGRLGYRWERWLGAGSARRLADEAPGLQSQLAQLEQGIVAIDVGQQRQSRRVTLVC